MRKIREQRQREESDLLNIECCHVDDVIDVRASANLLHVGQVPFRNIQSCTHTNTHRTRRPLAYQLLASEYQPHYNTARILSFLCRPADDDKELEQQQSQVLLLRLQAVGGFLDALQQLVAQNLQDVVWEERQHWGDLLWPGDTEASHPKETG